MNDDKRCWNIITRKCARCKKKFTTSTSRWVYKTNGHTDRCKWFCSWGCMRAVEREKEERLKQAAEARERAKQADKEKLMGRQELGEEIMQMLKTGKTTMEIQNALGIQSTRLIAHYKGEITKARNRKETMEAAREA